MCQAGRHFQRNDCERGKSPISLLKSGNPRRRRIVKLVLWVQISLLDCTGRWPSSTEVELTQAWSSGGQLEVVSLQNNNHQCEYLGTWEQRRHWLLIIKIQNNSGRTNQFWENNSTLRINDGKDFWKICSLTFCENVSEEHHVYRADRCWVCLKVEEWAHCFGHSPAKRQPHHLP